MSQDQNQHPKVLKFLNDYRKQLSLLKIKSFYTNHLCKKFCLEGKLLSNPNICFSGCDVALDRFYQIKREKNPDKQQQILFSSDKVEPQHRKQYQKNCVLAKMQIKDYLKSLDQFLEAEIKKYK